MTFDQVLSFFSLLLHTIASARFCRPAAHGSYRISELIKLSKTGLDRLPDSDSDSALAVQSYYLTAVVQTVEYRYMHMYYMYVPPPLRR